MMDSAATLPGPKPSAPAVGQFGIDSGRAGEVRPYRPTGCPSVEQFEARFGRANDGRSPTAI